MCEICKNSVVRGYTHCRNKHHYRLLLEIMQYKKNDKFKCYYRCTNGYASEDTRTVEHFKPNLMDSSAIPQV